MKRTKDDSSFKRTFITYIIPLLIIAAISVFFAISSVVNTEELAKLNFQKRIVLYNDTARLEFQLYMAKSYEAANILSRSESIIRWFSGDSNPVVKEISLRNLDSLMDSDFFDMSFAAIRSTGESYLGSNLIEYLSEDDPDDLWFYDSIKMDKSVEINVDYNGHIDRVLLWVNSKVFKNDSIIGIAGVGINIDDIKERLKKFIPGKNGSIYFVDESGEIKLSYPIDMINHNINEVCSPKFIELDKDFSGKFYRGDTIYTISKLPEMGLSIVTFALVSDFIPPQIRLPDLYVLFLIILILLLALFFIRIIYRLKKTVIEQSRSQEMMVMSMSLLAELKDYETGRHITRTRKYCRLLMEEMRNYNEFYKELTDDYVDNLEKSAALHDIGKVGIPDNILLKPGKFTPDEFDIIKKHTTMGAGVLETAIDKSEITPFLSMGLQIVRHHHEKWDGSGYPDGLSGRSIPLSARIMALADVYDALIIKRPYKEAISHEDAVKIIREGAGTHFQREIVESFIAREKEFEKISMEFTDIEEDSRI